MSRLLAIPVVGFAFFFCAASVECWRRVIHTGFPGDKLESFGVGILTGCTGVALVVLAVGLAVFGILENEHAGHHRASHAGIGRGTFMETAEHVKKVTMPVYGPERETALIELAIEMGHEYGRTGTFRPGSPNGLPTPADARKRYEERRNDD